MLIARLIADTDRLSANVDAAREELAAKGWPVAMAETVRSGMSAIELQLPHGEAAGVREVLDRHFAPSDVLVSDHEPGVPSLFVSDMDSTMISAECIDELADFAGIKHRIAEITERAMQGELDFENALRERVLLLRDLSESAIAECLDAVMPAIPYCIDLIEGPWLETDPAVIAAFRPKK